MRRSLLSLLLLCVGTLAAATPGPPTWKAVLMTGDDSIDAFDNARDEIGRRLFLMGIDPANVIDLSYAQTDPNGDPWPSSIDNLRAALLQLRVRPGDACLVHLTSHGSRRGFLLGDDPDLTPEILDAILDESCGDEPTVVLISACYSGIFVSPVMLKRNRIILTAARRDRTSFGCDAESEYTFWDGCLIDSLHGGEQWSEISFSIHACIEAKERIERERPSFPQAFFGYDVAHLRAPRFPPDLPGKRALTPAALFDALWGSPLACFAPPPERPRDEDAVCF